MATVNQHPAFADMGKAIGLREIPITDSSFLSLIKYDQNSFQMTVVFKNGAEYVHQSIFPLTIDQLIESPNKSKFYATQIRGKTPSSKIIDKSIGPRGGYSGKSNSRNAGGRRTNSGTKEHR
jgi:hypothetical protein